MPSTALDKLLLHSEVEEFLHHEAELLDARSFDAWLELLADDIRYWMPLSRNVASDRRELEYSRQGEDLNWFDEGKFELEQRVRQIQTGKHWSEEPLSRTTHMISNLRVEGLSETVVCARCRFLVYRNRTEVESDFFVGKREDHLRREGDSFKIAVRKIFLDQNVLLAKNLTVLF